MDHQPSQEEMDKLLGKSKTFKLTRYTHNTWDVTVSLISDDVWVDSSMYCGFYAALYLDEDGDLVCKRKDTFHDDFSLEEIH